MVTRVRSRAWFSVRVFVMSRARSSVGRRCCWESRGWRSSAWNSVRTAPGWRTWSPTSRRLRRAPRAGWSRRRSRATRAPGPGTSRTGKRRWRCREAACGRGSFTESLPAVPARARVTTRLRGECGAGIAERFSCVLAGAAHYRVSWPAAYVAHVQAALAAPLPAVAVLGIDETRRGKPKWEQDQATGRWRIAHDRWHTAIVDAHGTAGLLAHIDGRTAASVAEWLAAQPLSWRQQVRHVAI